MKKRIRKKLHIGEFKQYGNVIVIKTNFSEETAEEILMKFEAIIDSFSLTVAGGGTGRIIIPTRQGNKYIPTLPGLIVTSIAKGELPLDEMMFCIYVKNESCVPQEALGAIKTTFADKKYALQIGKSIDLWPNNFGRHNK
ncbi:50S ribosome-binding protein YggL [Sodaliphilus pleomorphus]|uniref:DUF469 family protein n=1 Tax=Sodaliphilus pleomorphus TaxID=2606626 RepID=A0A6L5XEI2_9BACT|nr:50S ribosome-binding protein YggL [Sodaliphilus pleomorphus]MSS17404.1 DUF469 family protein [Sodaliphilus pleomorphus]